MRDVREGTGEEEGETYPTATRTSAARMIESRLGDILDNFYA